MSSSYNPLPTSESTDNLGVDSGSHPGHKALERERRKTLRKRILVGLACLAVLFLTFKAGQYSVSKPSTTPSTPAPTTTSVPNKPDIEKPTPKPNTTMPHGGKRSVGYFVNWGIYGRKFPPSMIPVNDLTHILYAFANLKPDSGEVTLSDPWADQDIHYPGDSWNDVGTNLYGNFKAIYRLKQQNRHLKVLLSIGGWTYSPSFHPVVVNPAARTKFVESSVKILEDYGLDGLDVDYEYPRNDAEAKGYVELLKEMRYALDAHAHRKGNGAHFALTIAAPCGPDNMHKLHVKEMDRYLDFWNLMAYDFSGSWDSIANHQANIYGAPINAADAVDFYHSKGVAKDKLVLGIPLYGRSFSNTQGPGTPFSGVGQGSWEAGVYDYRALPLPGSYVMRDEKALASWTYNYETKEMVSFDNEEVAKWKGEYIKHKGLGGSMFWELSGDKNGERKDMEGGPGKEAQPGQSLVEIVKHAMGGLETSPNWLEYNESKFDNLRAGMPS